MNVSVRLRQSLGRRRGCACERELKVITPSGLSHPGRGEAARPHFLTHYHITSLCHPLFPLTFLSLPLPPPPSLSTCYCLNRVVQVTFSLVNAYHAYQFPAALLVFASTSH